jgi:hypothetical protein
MQMRVRVSELKFTLEVRGNGSAFNVTDSSAIARVELLSLIKTGDLLVAARVVLTLALTVVRRARMTILRRLSGEQRGRLVIMG